MHRKSKPVGRPYIDCNCLNHLFPRVAAPRIQKNRSSSAEKRLALEAQMELKLVEVQDLGLQLGVPIEIIEPTLMEIVGGEGHGHCDATHTPWADRVFAQDAFLRAPAFCRPFSNCREHRR